MSLLLFLHVLGAVLFLGNIIITAFWKVMADTSGDLNLIYIASQKVLIADYIFTIPGLILLIVTGNVMAYSLGYPMSGWNWVSVSNWLFIVTGIIWCAVLLPLQFRMVRSSKESLLQGSLNESYVKAYRHWILFGSLATLIPVYILYVMTVKPF